MGKVSRGLPKQIYTASKVISDPEKSKLAPIHMVPRETTPLYMKLGILDPASSSHTFVDSFFTGVKKEQDYRSQQTPSLSQREEIPP